MFALLELTVGLIQERHLHFRGDVWYINQTK